MEVGPEQLLAADGAKVRQNLSAVYGIPASLLVPSMNPILLAVDDNVIFPFSEYWSHRRWARVGSLEALKRACFFSRRILEDKILMLFIMPYLSLQDAFTIRGLIENSGQIMADVNKNPGSSQLKLPVPGRYGILPFGGPDQTHDPDHPLTVEFFVINYGLLESKAREHERLSAMIDEINDSLNKVNYQMTGLLQNPSLARASHPHSIQKVEEDGRIAHEELMLSLYMHGIDPHDVICDLDTDVHDTIYDADFDPCNPDAPDYEDMPDGARARLDDYMQQLVASGCRASHHEHAELEVLAAEGSYDAESAFARVSKCLKQALDNYNEDLYALLGEFTSADTRCSLIGVQGKRDGVVMNIPEGD